MTVAALLRRLAEAGAGAILDAEGQVRIRPASAVPADLLAEMRQHREAIATAMRAAALASFAQNALTALSGREPDPIEEAERSAHFGSEAETRPYQPSDPDLLRDGLLNGVRAHRTRPGTP